jgi:hypothetical protein
MLTKHQTYCCHAYNRRRCSAPPLLTVHSTTWHTAHMFVMFSQSLCNSVHITQATRTIILRKDVCLAKKATMFLLPQPWHSCTLFGIKYNADIKRQHHINCDLPSWKQDVILATSYCKSRGHCRLSQHRSTPGASFNMAYVLNIAKGRSWSETLEYAKPKTTMMGSAQTPTAIILDAMFWEKSCIHQQASEIVRLTLCKTIGEKHTWDMVALSSLTWLEVPMLLWKQRLWKHTAS